MTFNLYFSLAALLFVGMCMIVQSKPIENKNNDLTRSHNRSRFDERIDKAIDNRTLDEFTRDTLILLKQANIMELPKQKKHRLIKDAPDQDQILDNEFSEMIDNLISHGCRPETIDLIVDMASNYDDRITRNEVFRTFMEMTLRKTHFPYFK